MLWVGVSDADDLLAAPRREIDGLKERARVLESKEVAGADASSAIGEENEHQRMLPADGVTDSRSLLSRTRTAVNKRQLEELRADLQAKLDLLSSENSELRADLADLQGKLDLLSTENNGIKERICALEGQELRRKVALIDVALEVGDETKAWGRRPSVIASSLMAFEDTEDAAETEEHELADSMWDACLFLGCKDEFNLKGESMNVGILVTIFGVLALVINALIQTAIVFVVVSKMADNADIDDGTAADMRHVPLNG